MRPDESFVGQPIRSLQTMLRVLGEYDERYENVVPDGIYGSQTIRAVSAFQRNHGLPVTGITDQETWERIVCVHDDARMELDIAQPLEIILNPGERIKRGQSSPYLFVVQAVLTVLAQSYQSITVPSQTGVLDAATSDALSAFQCIAGLPMTGELDKITWKHMALHFPLAANLKKGTVRT